jgi:hypothetical protein
LRRLTRNSQIGEFYTLMPPQVDPGANQKHTCDILIYGAPRRPPRTLARSHALTPARPPAARVPTRARRMADEESDKHVRVSWKDALEATMLETGVGANADKVDTVDGAGNPIAMKGSTINLGDWLTRATTIMHYNANTTDAGLGRVPTFADIDPDIRLVVCRPFSATPPAPARTPALRRAHAFVRARRSRAHDALGDPGRQRSRDGSDSVRPKRHAALGQHPSQDVSAAAPL